MVTHPVWVVIRFSETYILGAILLYVRGVWIKLDIGRRCSESPCTTMNSPTLTSLRRSGVNFNGNTPNVDSKALEGVAIRTHKFQSLFHRDLLIVKLYLVGFREIQPLSFAQTISEIEEAIPGSPRPCLQIYVADQGNVLNRIADHAAGSPRKTNVCPAAL